MALTYEALRSAVSDGGVGVRARLALEPLGGQGTKVFPPSYATGEDATTKYAVEPVRSPSPRMFVVAPRDDVTTKYAIKPVEHDTIGNPTEYNVVLDSVASQANRHELALLEAIRDGDLQLPLTSVDFAGEQGLAGVGSISDLEAPHRVFDAILRDSLDGDVLFRLGEVGRSITDASPKNATALFTHSPATLVFGGWDSTGPRGGRGAKYERAFTSEILAAKARLGVKTESRLDPLGIEIKAAKLYTTPEGAWSLDEVDAERDAKGAPVPAKPSRVNHGNFAPSVDTTAGGITAESIEAVSVLSFIQLRRLRFPVDAAGKPFDRTRVKQVELAARTALAALALAASVLAFEQGLDLRSRCVLAPTGPLEYELVGRAGEKSTFTLNRQEALDLVAQAAAASAAAGLPWRSEELVLKPAPHLAELVRRSRAMTGSSASEEA